MTSDPAPNGPSEPSEPGHTGAQSTEGGNAAEQAEPVERLEMQPMETNDVMIVAVGTVLFAIAFIVMLPMHSSLQHSGHGRWLWVALSGFILGLLGLAYCLRRAQRISKVNSQ